MPAPKKIWVKSTKKEVKVAPKKIDLIEAPTESANNEWVPSVVVSQDTWSKNLYLLLWIIIVAIAIALLLFSQKQVIPWSPHLQNQNSASLPAADWECKLSESTVDSTKVVADWSSIKVDYIWKLEDWSIFDSSIEACSKKTPKYVPNSWRTFEPLGFVVWQKQMIKWFDTWVVWMKLWESKTITIEPKDAYWEASVNQTVEAKYLKDSFEQEVPADSFNDIITKTFPKEMLWDKKYKVWDEIKSESLNWKVTALTETWITIAINNTQNPFLGKKITVGAKWEYQWNEITIKKVTKDLVTVTVLNKQSPFYWKEIKAWLTGKLPNWQEVKIVSIEDSWKAVVAIPNTHELAWKKLIFEVQIKQID